MVRKEVFDTDKAFFGPSAKLMRIKPFPIGLAKGYSHAYGHELVKNAVMFIGHTKYDRDLPVAPILAVEYLLGNSFIIIWNAVFRPRSSVLNVGVDEDNYVRDAAAGTENFSKKGPKQYPSYQMSPKLRSQTSQK